MKLRARWPYPFLVPFAAVATLVACGGGATGVAPAAPGGAPSQTPAQATLELFIPVVSNASKGRRPHFVSPSTQSALIVSTKPGASALPVVVDLSNASTACSIQAGNRVCHVVVQMVIGATTLAITTYDQPAANGVIPSGAHELGTGTFSITPSALSTPIVVAIDAVVAGIGNLPAFTSLPADGANHTYGFVLNPADFDNNPISNANAAYANPIAVSLSESGGTAHAWLMLDGKRSGSPATLTSSSDTIAVQYDGSGAPGYSIAVGFSASGLASMSTTISPLYVTSSSGMYVPPDLTLAGSSTSALFKIQEANAPGATVFTAIPSGCTPAATVGPIAQVDGVSAFTVAGTATDGSCDVDVSDGTSAIVVSVLNSTPTPSPTPTPTPTPVPTSTPTPTPPP